MLGTEGIIGIMLGNYRGVHINIKEFPRQFSFLVYDTGEVISQAILDNGTWEPFQTAVHKILLTENGRPAGNFIDVGANIGWHSVTMSIVLSDNGRVYSFEPHPGNFALLQNNIGINKLKNINAINMACSDSAGTAELYFGPAGNMGTHSLHKEDRDDSVTVEMVRIDQFFENNPLFKGPIVFKIDTEGNESSVLLGASKTINSNKENISVIAEINTNIQIHSTEDCVGLIKFFELLGMKAFAISQARCVLYPITYSYLASTASRMMGEHGKFYGELLFCREDSGEKLKQFIHHEVDAISFRAM